MVSQTRRPQSTSSLPWKPQTSKFCSSFYMTHRNLWVNMNTLRMNYAVGIWVHIVVKLCPDLEPLFRNNVLLQFCSFVSTLLKGHSETVGIQSLNNAASPYWFCHSFHRKGAKMRQGSRYSCRKFFRKKKGYWHRLITHVRLEDEVV